MKVIVRNFIEIFNLQLAPGDNPFVALYVSIAWVWAFLWSCRQDYIFLRVPGKLILCHYRQFIFHATQKSFGDCEISLLKGSNLGVKNINIFNVLFT